MFFFCFVNLRPSKIRPGPEGNSSLNTVFLSSEQGGRRVIDEGDSACRQDVPGVVGQRPRLKKLSLKISLENRNLSWALPIDTNILGVR